MGVHLGFLGMLCCSVPLFWPGGHYLRIVSIIVSAGTNERCSLSIWDDFGPSIALAGWSAYSCVRLLWMEYCWVLRTEAQLLLGFAVEAAGGQEHAAAVVYHLLW